MVKMRTIKNILLLPWWICRLAYAMNRLFQASYRLAKTRVEYAERDRKERQRLAGGSN
jgi:hypothetical protein